MHEILRSLSPGARVLDLGSAAGSFADGSCLGSLVVRLDLEPPPGSPAKDFVQGDAVYLPFGDGTFDAVIANHCLEHVEKLDTVLHEVGRVLRQNGSLFIAVPDASTFSDRLYRWIYHGGGHINPFCSPAGLRDRIAQATGLRPVAIKTLYASLIFLQHAHFHPRPPHRLWLLGNGNPRFIAILNYSLRVIDQLFGSRSSVYGWAFYFGSPLPELDTHGWTNVCVHCGAGHPAAWLKLCGAVRRGILGVRVFDCPACGGWNIFTGDAGITAA